MLNPARRNYEQRCAPRCTQALSVAVGGMSLLMSSMLEASAAASVVSAGMAAYSSIQQGQQQAAVAKQKATQEQITETQKQITMRQNMLRALASQNAGTLGAVATGGASSFAANARRQITQNQNDLLMSKANTSAQVSLLDQSAANDVAAGDIGAASTAFGGLATGANAIGSVLAARQGK